MVQCQHTGAHTMWEISTMQPSVRPAFQDRIVNQLLAVDLEPNRMLMDQVRAWSNQPSLALRTADHHIKVLLQVRCRLAPFPYANFGAVRTNLLYP